LVSQIIISHEDSTSFFSIGSVQDDATLVSALGGALASFAIEMGLSDTGATQANYSKFQNGILISKWLEVGNHKPSLMIAVRGYDNLQQYQQMFLIDYGTLLVNKIVTMYEKLYAGAGEVPHFNDAVKVVPNIVNKLYKDSPNTLKDFLQEVDKFCQEYLADLWTNQGDRSIHRFDFRTKTYNPTKIGQIQEDFVNHFYREGVGIDALFPLKFASTPDLSATRKFISGYLKKKSKDSRSEIVNEITKIANQLHKMSSSRSRRGKQEVLQVDLINANILFEQISVTKIKNYDKARSKILNDLYANLLQKLYQKFPLKFISAGLTNPIDIQYIKSSFEKAVQDLLQASLAETPRLTKQIAGILRDVATDYTPDEAIKNSAEIQTQVETKFIEKLMKDDPFIILADAQLKKVKKLATKLAKDSFVQYRTAHDEAMALWYIIRQTNQSLSKLKTISITNQMKVYLLQDLMRKYQFRSVPKIIYDLTKGILKEVSSSSSSSDPVVSLLQRNLNAFQKDSGIVIPDEIRKVIFKRIKIVKASQSFENIEALSFFSNAFSSALESTIVKILELFFGTKSYPRPPVLLSNAIEKLIITSQSVYSISKILVTIIEQPGVKDFFKKEAENIITKTLNFTSVFPTIIELARIALEKGWMVELKKGETLKTNATKATGYPKKDLEKLTDNQLLSKTIAIPSLSKKGKLSRVIKEPVIAAELMVLFVEAGFQNRYSALTLELKKIEKKTKTSAGSASGKKKLASKIKLMKSLMKSYEHMFSGGNFLQKIFSRKKDFQKSIQVAATENYPGLNYYPENFRVNGENGSVTIDPMFGEYQRIIEVDASTWVRDSEYIGKLKEEIIWRIIEKDTNGIPLEKRIVKNLQQAAAKGKKVDQETIVRTTIEEEVTLLFNKAVRESITLAFNSIEDDLIVKIDQRSKENYIVINTLDLDKRFIQPVIDKLLFTKCFKKTSDKSEVRVYLNELLPSITSRKKKAQSIRGYLRDGLRENFRSYHLKALNSLGELIDLYIGELATDLFYTKSHILEQLLLESIDQS